MLTVGSLFSGIGGMDLGFERAGMRVVWQIEIDPYATRILEKHWPHVLRFRDVRACGAHNLPAVDLVCGGFPCQPFSVAGKRRGARDDRNLWPEMRRIVEELRPRWVVAENTPGIASLYLDTVLSDLEDLGYASGTVEIPACAVGAPHIRQRLFVIAHADRRRAHVQQECGARLHAPSDADGDGALRPVADASQHGWQSRGAGDAVQESGGGQPHRGGECGNVADADRRRLEGGAQRHGGAPEDPADGHPRRADSDRLRDTIPDADGARLLQPGTIGGEPQQPGAESHGDWGQWWRAEPDVGRVADGVPHRVERLRCLGNAVVPQVVEAIGRAILMVEDVS